MPFSAPDKQLLQQRLLVLNEALAGLGSAVASKKVLDAELDNRFALVNKDIVELRQHWHAMLKLTAAKH